MDKDLVRFYSWIIDYSVDNACWEWGGATNNKYGVFRCRGKTYLAHRWIYLQYMGFIPHGCEVDHICTNRTCVNPRHLEAVTHLENMRRSAVNRPRKMYCKRGHIRIPENLTAKNSCKRCYKELYRS
jgi:hypothetical protein